jgi:hypothetical protein
VKKTGGDEEKCFPMRKLAHSICLDEWMTQWDEQREKGNFLGIQEKAAAAAKAHH